MPPIYRERRFLQTFPFVPILFDTGRFIMKHDWYVDRNKHGDEPKMRYACITEVMLFTTGKLPDSSLLRPELLP
jgi:hypothetical protein